jgi:hypothetical protein
MYEYRFKGWFEHNKIKKEQKIKNKESQEEVEKVTEVKRKMSFNFRYKYEKNVITEEQPIEQEPEQKNAVEASIGNPNIILEEVFPSAIIHNLTRDQIQKCVSLEQQIQTQDLMR